jgi:aminoglycoside phosphotransferase (APT) family kinase protein
MSREYRVQKALAPFYDVVPKMIDLCEDESVLGAPFYVMERIDGLIPRKNLPKEITLDKAGTRALCISVIDKLIELHKVDPHAAGLDKIGKGPGYARRQVEGWSDRYEKAKTWNVPSYRYIRDWLRANVPDDVAQCVVHNDYRFDNVVLDRKDQARVIGVLDWEMATIGDPLMDLGSSLAYWVEPTDDIVARTMRRQPTHLPGMLTRREVIDRYLETMSDRIAIAPKNWVFYEVFGLFRLAVIAQQIYYRYHHKQTRNPAFRFFWVFVHYFDLRARRLIKSART